MNKERVKQALNEIYAGRQIMPSDIIDIIVDAVEMMKQDEQVLIGQTLQVQTGALIVCPECEGRGHVSSKASTSGVAVCTRCAGYGSITVISNTPSA